MSSDANVLAFSPKSVAGPARILAVDDDELAGRMYGRVLHALGHRVSVARDGLEALAMIGKDHYDTVIADLAMPQMDGIELLRAIRDEDLDLPVVIVTGGPEVVSAMKAVEFGALRYLVKPVAPAELGRVVGEAVQLHRLAILKRTALERSGELRSLLGDRAGLEARLARALRSIWIAFQPIVSASEGRVVAFEALMRCDEPSLPTPPAILHAAERLGRLHELGRAVRRRIAEDAPLLPGEPQLFVNLHPLDLTDDELVSVDGALTPMAGRVVLEVTERVALDQVEDLDLRIGELRRTGFRIAIDDLGQGYAGLTSFARLNPEVVKLDMSLVRGIDSDATQRGLVRSMAALTRELGIGIVAEGVETEAERHAVVELGCGLLQGYLLGRPARAASWGQPAADTDSITGPRPVR